MATRKSTPATKRATAKTQVLGSAKSAKPEVSGFARFYLALAHGFGATARAFSHEKIAKEDRRDGPPFFMAVLGVLGVVFSWFLIQESWAQLLHSWTFGMLFGPVSFVLPVIMIVFAVYLSRHPSTPRDNSRIGIGLFLQIFYWASVKDLLGAAQ
jgi:S-DNA-T family DNA segregation ATPase FtsK/SpoIIIE